MPGLTHPQETRSVHALSGVAAIFGDETAKPLATSEPSANAEPRPWAAQRAIVTPGEMTCRTRDRHGPSGADKRAPLAAIDTDGRGLIHDVLADRWADLLTQRRL